MAITTVKNELIAENAVSGTIIADNAVTAVHIAQNAVTATQIPAGSITTGQLAADAVSGAKLADSSVVTANIQDDQVTLDKMAGLARGRIIYGDSSNNPVALALGSSGQVLKSDGSDIAWGTDAGLSNEQVQDIVGGMFTGNTETNITVTYQDGDGTIDVVGDATELRTILRVIDRSGSYIDCTVTDATLPVTARSGTVTVRKVSLPVQVIPQITYR